MLYEVITIVKLLGHRYGDGLVYLENGSEHHLFHKAVRLGLVSRRSIIDKSKRSNCLTIVITSYSIHYTKLYDLLGQLPGPLAHPLLLQALDHVHRDFGEVAHDGFHVPAHVAHLGELGGLHLA